MVTRSWGEIATCAPDGGRIDSIAAFDCSGLMGVPGVSRLYARWLVMHTSSERELRSALMINPRMRVGLVGLRADVPALRAVEDVLRTHPSVLWIALVSREALQMFTSRRLIASFCYDYHTLPIDVRRLMAILGHAHGWAHLQQVDAACAASPDFGGSTRKA